jgi:hypothetical protein
MQPLLLDQWTELSTNKINIDMMPAKRAQGYWHASAFIKISILRANRDYMTASLETALQRISNHISTRRFKPSWQSLDAVRDAFIDTYGCMLIGATQPVALKTCKALRCRRRLSGIFPVPIVNAEIKNDGF